MADLDMMKMRGGLSLGDEDEEEAPDSEREEELDEDEAEDGPALMKAMWAACKKGDYAGAFRKLEDAVTLIQDEG